MDTNQKQQVVFIARTLWGGGVEKVLYELSHGLDRDLFSPTVIYLIDEKNLIEYDASTPTISLQSYVDELIPPASQPEGMVIPSIQTNPVDNPPLTPPSQIPAGKQKAIRFFQRFYNILPSSSRERLHLRQRVKKIKSTTPIIKQKILLAGRSIYYIFPNSLRERLHLRKRFKFVDATARNDLPKENIAAQTVIQHQHEGDKVYFSVPNSIPVSYEITNSISEIWIQALALRNALQNFSQDAVLIPMDEYNTVILWLAQLPPIRKVLASQHYPYSQAQPIRYPVEQVQRVKEWMYLNACRSAEVVTFDSEGSRMDFINNYGASPRRTISMPNLINCALILQKSQQPLDIDLKQFGNKTIFTQVARLSLEKNPLLLVEACNILRKKYDNFVVLYVGNGPMEQAMREQIEKRKLENHIIMLGEQANPYPHMAAARALLLTSRAESSPLVLVECMLCGSVPIATDCVAGPRELLDNGKFGLLTPPDDAKAFAEAMYQIATDDNLYHHLRENACNHAYRFDVPRVVKEWEELILKVAKNQIDDYRNI